MVDESEKQMGSALSNYGTVDCMELMEARLLQAMAEMEARQARHTNQAVGIMLAGIALAVALILGFG